MYIYNSGGSFNITDAQITIISETLPALQADKAGTGISIKNTTIKGSLKIVDGMPVDIVSGTFEKNGLDLEKFNSYVNSNSTVKTIDGMEQSYTVSENSNEN